MGTATTRSTGWRGVNAEDTLSNTGANTAEFGSGSFIASAMRFASWTAADRGRFDARSQPSTRSPLLHGIRNRQGESGSTATRKSKVRTTDTEGEERSKELRIH